MLLALLTLSLIALALALPIAVRELRRRVDARPPRADRPVAGPLELGLYDPGRERRAEARARELLRSCVNDEEWAMYRDLGFLRVGGKHARRESDQRGAGGAGVRTADQGGPSARGTVENDAGQSGIEEGGDGTSSGTGRFRGGSGGESGTGRFRGGSGDESGTGRFRSGAGGASGAGGGGGTRAGGRGGSGGDSGGDAAYAYLVYPHKPIVAYVPESGQLLSEYCVEFPDLSGSGGRHRLPASDDVLAKWMALTSDEDRVIRRANMHLVGRQHDPARVRRDLWRLAEWERRRAVPQRTK